MKIALLGSAPSSLPKAPQGDPSWTIWACSPGCYPVLARVDEFFEIHRWEPGVIGKGATQKPWFTPEYVQWLKTFPPKIWVADPQAQRDLGGYPRVMMLPWQDLVKKYGHYLWTSTLAYMACMAIDRIMESRAQRLPGAHEPDAIGFWGVDMAANEELYSNQRAALQTILSIVSSLDIAIEIPPESDLGTPPPMYGVSECTHRGIKWTERKRELEYRLRMVNAQLEELRATHHSIIGALDDHQYHQTMWAHPGEDTLGIQFESVYPWFGSGKKGYQAAAATPIAPPAVSPTLKSPIPLERTQTQPAPRKPEKKAHKGNGAARR